MPIKCQSLNNQPIRCQYVANPSRSDAHVHVHVHGLTCTCACTCIMDYMYKRPPIGRGLAWSVPMRANAIAFASYFDGLALDWHLADWHRIEIRLAQDWWWIGTWWVWNRKTRDWHWIGARLVPDCHRIDIRLVSDLRQIGVRLGSIGTWLHQIYVW